MKIKQKQKMEQKNLNQDSSQESSEPRIRSSSDDVKIRVSRDGKWIIIRVPGIDQPVIKPVAYFEKILERARTRTPYDVEKIKG
jgi:hypothetical protein